MMTKDGKILLANYTKQQFDMSYFRKTTSVTQLLPDYGIAVSTDQPLQIKESKKDDIQAIETFVDDILHLMKNGKKENQKKRLRDYSDGEYVPVEVTEVSAKRIMLRTIDPEYNIISGQLVFEQNLKIFPKYTPRGLGKVLKVGERFNANVNTSNNSFSITNLFVDYIYVNAGLKTLLTPIITWLPAHGSNCASFGLTKDSWCMSISQKKTMRSCRKQMDTRG
jgi:hypothetical protein